MIKIGIVEDEQAAANLLKNYIDRYGEKNHLEFSVTHMLDGLDLVEDYQGQYDILLLDIQMKHLDGMSAAEKIRKQDSDVVIIFITTTVRYAVQGYSVDALGYVLKPVPYTALEQLLDKAIQRVKANKDHVYIRVQVEDQQLRIDCDDIEYIESQRNNVLIHTKDHTHVTTGPLKKYEELLSGHGFSKCHNAYLVNLSMVEAIKKEEVILSSGGILPISRARKKEFMAELTADIM